MNKSALVVFAEALDILEQKGMNDTHIYLIAAIDTWERGIYIVFLS